MKTSKNKVLMSLIALQIFAYPATQGFASTDLNGQSGITQSGEDDILVQIQKREAELKKELEFQQDQKTLLNELIISLDHARALAVTVKTGTYIAVPVVAVVWIYAFGTSVIRFNDAIKYAAASWKPFFEATGATMVASGAGYGIKFAYDLSAEHAEAAFQNAMKVKYTIDSQIDVIKQKQDEIDSLKLKYSLQGKALTPVQRLEIYIQRRAVQLSKEEKELKIQSKFVDDLCDKLDSAINHREIGRWVSITITAASIAAALKPTVGYADRTLRAADIIGFAATTGSWIFLYQLPANQAVSFKADLELAQKRLDKQNDEIKNKYNELYRLRQKLSALKGEI